MTPQYKSILTHKDNSYYSCYLSLELVAQAGFSNYAEECWHFNYGNQMDAAYHDATARYGHIEPTV